MVVQKEKEIFDKKNNVQSELNKINNQLSKEIEAKSQYEQERTKLRPQLEQQNTKLQSQEQQQSQIQSRLSAAQSNREKMKQEVMDITRVVAKADEDLKKINNTICNLNRNEEDVRKEMRENQRNLERAQEKKNEKLAVSNEIENKIKSLQTDINNTKNNIKEQKLQREHLVMDLQKTVTEQNRLKSDLTVDQQRCLQLEKEKSSINNDLTIVTSKLKENTTYGTHQGY